MTQPIDLKALERKMYLSYYEDGLLDLFLGAWFLFFGLLLQYRLAAFSGVLAAVLLTLWIALKKTITSPRLGRVEFSSQRKAGEKRKLRLLVLAGFLTLIGGLFNFLIFTHQMPGWKMLMRDLDLLPLGAIAAGLMLAVGFLFDFQRLYAYAAIIAVFFVICHWIGVDPVWHFTPPAIAILGMGATMLVRFLEKYPKPQPEIHFNGGN